MDKFSPTGSKIVKYTDSIQREFLTTFDNDGDLEYNDGSDLLSDSDDEIGYGGQKLFTDENGDEWTEDLIFPFKTDFTEKQIKELVVNSKLRASNFVRVDSTLYEVWHSPESTNLSKISNVRGEGEWEFEEIHTFIEEILYKSDDVEYFYLKRYV